MSYPNNTKSYLNYVFLLFNPNLIISADLIPHHNRFQKNVH